MAKETNKYKNLLHTRENSWCRLSESEKKAVEVYAHDYMKFLSDGKTERETYELSVKMLELDGFVPLKNSKASLVPGTKLFLGTRQKILFAAHVGRRPLTDGFRILGAHIDAPRLDLKPAPLYQDSNLALFDTHYYGGIKKYQWVALPLAMHGSIVKTDGSVIHISIGEKENEPVFVINDLLPHLGKEQIKKTMDEAITGEGLNILIGSDPIDDEEAKDRVKLNVLQILNTQFKITEEDFASAEIEFVPAGRARELGIDRSMILGYGQDDRICAYASLRALLDIDKPEYTSVVLLCDKEEIGSYGATGMESTFFENAARELLHCAGIESERELRACLERSKMISADVHSLHDPNYPEVSSPHNMAELNAGVVLQKYTGSGGKYNASEASAEFMAEMRNMLNDGGVFWQSAELGKVDGGGGGTIALYMARHGMDVVDCGPGLFSMHAPYETCGKLDAYMSYKCYKTFLK